MDKEWIQAFRTEIKAFSEKVTEFEQGEIDRKAYKGFSGGMGSYAQKDAHCHMLRLRLPGGRLTKERLKFVAETVENYQVSRMKFTTCEAIQLHNLKGEQLPEIMEKAIDSAIFSKGGGGDNPRNVMSSPLSGVQQGEYLDVMPWVEAVTEYLLSICRDIHMPRKLKIAFGNGVDDCVHTAFRDMGFMANQDGTFSLHIAGGLGGSPKMGILVEEQVAPEDVLYYIKAMIDTFCAHGNYQNRAKARTRFMQETLGIEGLKKAYLENVEKAKMAGGLQLSVKPIEISKQGDGSIENARVLPQKQAGLYTVKYHPLGGCPNPQKMRELYETIQAMPEVECRVAPNESLYILNLTAKEAEEVLRVTADSARTEFENSVACIGAAVCQQGLRDSQTVLQAAKVAVEEANIPDGALPRIRISGCPSSCAAHQAGTIGFQGWSRPLDGKPASAFKMFLDGSDELGKEQFGKEVGVVYEKDLPALLVELGQAAAMAGQNWNEWSKEHAEQQKEIIEKYL